MRAEDIALYQQATELARTGQKQAAYLQFCTLHQQGGYTKEEEIALLYWIAYTTPSLEELQRATATLARLDPENPKLQELRAYLGRKQQQGQLPVLPPGKYGAVIECPYCHTRAPGLIASKVSTGGWVFFVVVLILFFPLCWIGLLIREQYYVCTHCYAKLG